MSFDRRLKSVRSQVFPTQQDFADALGMARPTVSNWERGAFIPEPQTIKLICSLLGVDETWLLTGKGNPRTLGTKAQDTPQHEPFALDVALGGGRMTLVLDLFTVGNGEFQVVGRMTRNA